MTTDADDRPRWFGRARRLKPRKRLAEVWWDTLYAGAWPARIAWRVGLQGRLDVSEHHVALPTRAPGRPPIRLAFASDFHAGPATAPRLQAEVGRVLRAMRADLVLLGGDFVSFHARHLRSILPLLRDIQAPLGVHAVLGNHDLIGDDRWIVRRLEDAGIHVLVNASRRLPPPHDDVWICGLDDQRQGEPDADRAFAGADGVRLLLMHSPDGLQAAAGHRWDAAFCGHVHGGQFLLPGGRALVRHHTEWSSRYARGGLVRVPVGPADERPMLVSRGIGCGNFPLRRGADPQVHLVTLGG